MDRSWTSSLVVLVSLTGALGVLECLSKALSPPPQKDPRLGTVMFWLWVAMMAGVTYVLWPHLDDARPLDFILWAIGAVAWLAWKLGITKAWDDTPREREEIWATTVGVILAIILWGMSR